jgi:PAS domain S-box-containing protein
MSLVAVFLILGGIFFLALDARKNALQKEYLQFVTEKYTIAYNTIYDQFRQLAQALHSGMVTRYHIVDLYERLQNATPQEKKEIRQELLDRTYPRYKEVLHHGIRQLHFHLPNNESFLRLHRPKKNGDNLTDVRATVMYVNEKHKPIDGFENGRIFDGYRFVFPITSKTGKHLGSMEISFGPSSLTSAMMKQYVVLSNFFIKDLKIKQYVFKDEAMNNYKESHHPGYLYDMQVLKALKKASNMDMKTLQPPADVSKALYENAHSGEIRSLPAPSIDAIYTTIPVINPLTKEMLAFFTVRSKAHVISQIETEHTIVFILGLIILGISLAYFYQQNSQKKALEIYSTELFRQKQQLINTRNALQKSELQLKEAQRIVQIGSWERDLTTNTLTWSDEVYNILGVEKSASFITYEQYLQAIHYDDKKRVESYYAKASHNNEPYNIDYRLIINGSTLKYVNEQCHIFFSDDDIPIRAFGTIHDITKRKKAEELVINERNKFERMFRTHSAVMLIIDPKDGAIVEANNSAIAFYGYSAEQLKSMNISDINNLSKEEIKNKMKHAKSGAAGVFYFKHQKSNGSIVDVEVFCSPLVLEDEELLFSIINDISERVENEERIANYQAELETINENLEERVLEQTKERMNQEVMFKQMFDSLDNFISVIDAEHKYIAVNDTYMRRFGIPYDKIVGQHVSAVLGDKKYSVLAPILDKVMQGEVASYISEMVIQNKACTIDGTFTPYRESDGSIIGVIVNAADITERKKLEADMVKREQLMIQQSKLADMGSMIAVIAHQWKQPLNILSLTMSLYEDENKEDENVKELAQRVRDQINFMSDTVNDFRNFYNPSKYKKMFSVHESIQKIITLLNPKMLTQDINITLSGDESIKAYGYRNEFMQVIMNLINNAKDAILSRNIKNGKINIEVHDADESVNVFVSDNAGGIPEHMLPNKIFEQFFTTKGDAGTGIGLSMSRTIIEKYMEGELTASNKDGGAFFKINVPCNKEEYYEKAESNTVVLLVEDDEFTLMSMTEILSKIYKHVYTANNGLKGLDMFHEHKSEISVVITDLDMPKQNGIDMSKQIRAVDPDMPIIVTTAIKQDIFEDIGFDAIFEKPVPIKDLKEKIAEILN